MSQIPCFIINLARSESRLKKMTAALADMNIEFRRIEAVDGEFLGASEVASFYDSNHTDVYYKHLNNGEIACYLSHRKAWQIMVDEQLPFAVILEDDITLTDGLVHVMETVSQLPTDWDYIKLAEQPVKRKAVDSQEFASLQRVIYNKLPARTCAQVVSLAGAHKLLNHSQRIFRPIDIDLQYWWEKELRVFGLIPYVAMPDMTVNSEIDTRQQRRHATQSLVQKWRNMWQFFWLNRRYLKRRLAAIQRAK